MTFPPINAFTASNESDIASALGFAAEGTPGDDLVSRIERLAEHLVSEGTVDAEGEPATLVALLPCEPVTGEACVVVWNSSGEYTSYELVDFTGARVPEPRALREALILLAMTESLEEQLDPLRVREVMDALIAWQETAKEASTDAGGSQRDQLRDAVGTAIWPVIEQLQLLEHAIGDPDEVRLARASRLDELGGLLRALEAAWIPLEGAAGAWADATMTAEDSSEADGKLVERLWNALAAARRGPLAAPASSVIEAGRAAGAALADEVLGKPGS